MQRPVLLTKPEPLSQGEALEYLEKHQLRELFAELTAQCVIQHPNEPLELVRELLAERQRSRGQLALTQSSQSLMSLTASSVPSTIRRKQSFAEVLGSLRVQDLPAHDVITVLSSESCTEGFKKLTDNHILSAPVWDEEAKQYTGFLDIRDLVSFAVFVDDDNHTFVPDDIGKLLGHAAQKVKLPIENLTPTYMSRRNRFTPVKETDTLLDVAKILTGRHVHRVPVLGEDGKVAKVISQSTVARLLFRHGHKGKDVKPPISEVGIGTSPVQTVSADTKAIDVFRLLDNKKLSGLAVVDEAGRLIGNTSGSDLKLFLKTTEIGVTEKPIVEYLKEIRSDQKNIRDVIVSADASASVGSVLEKIVASRVHRIFIASEDKGFIPEKVVSITDLLKWAVREG